MHQIIVGRQFRKYFKIASEGIIETSSQNRSDTHLSWGAMPVTPIILPVVPALKRHHVTLNMCNCYKSIKIQIHSTHGRFDHLGLRKIPFLTYIKGTRLVQIVHENKSVIW